VGRPALGAGLACILLLSACGGNDPTRPQGKGDLSARVEPTGPAQSVGIVAVGDIACKPGARVTKRVCQQAATADLAASLDPDAVIALGDLQYESGTAADFAGSYDQSWGRLRSITRPVPGNHEYNSHNADGYFGYADQSQPWYAWQAGDWRIYMLNSNCHHVDCGAEEDWLRADLADHPTGCSAIAMHHPRYSSGKHHSQADMAGLWQIAFDARVDLALAGHDHDYERFEAMDAQGGLSPGRGLVSFVSGTGGRSLNAQGGVETGSAYFQSEQFGVLDLTLAPDGFSWEYVAIDGSILDQGRADCV
jgi:hypothetical protein